MARCCLARPLASPFYRSRMPRPAAGERVPNGRTERRRRIRSTVDHNRIYGRRLLTVLCLEVLVPLESLQRNNGHTVFSSIEDGLNFRLECFVVVAVDDAKSEL